MQFRFACLLAPFLVALPAAADMMTFPPGSFDISNPNYVGEHVVLSNQLEGFFPEGNFSSGYQGIAYELGEPVETTSLTADLSDAGGLGLPSNLTSFESEASIEVVPGLNGLASEITVDHGQFGQLTTTPDDGQTRNFLSTIASQIVGEAFALGGSPTFELIVTIDSLLEQAGLTGASEGLSVKVVEYLEGGGIREILGVDGFYFIDSAGNESVFYQMTDAVGGSTDVSDSFGFSQSGDAGNGAADFSYAMQFDAAPGSSIGVLMLSDIGIDTFGAGTVSLATRFTTSYTLRAVTPGAGLLFNNRALIPEPGAAALMAVGGIVCGPLRRSRR